MIDGYLQSANRAHGPASVSADARGAVHAFSACGIRHAIRYCIKTVIRLVIFMIMIGLWGLRGHAVTELRTSISSPENRVRGR